MHKLLLACLIACSPVMGNTWTKGPHRIFLGPSYLHNHYQFVSGTHDNENLWGVTAGYEYYKPCSLFFRARALLDWGKAHGTEAPWTDQRQIGQAELGYTWALLKNWFFTPYIGVGFFRDREPFPDSSPVTQYAGYVPAGLLIGWDINYEWTIKLRTQADMIFFRKVHPGDGSESLSKKTNWEIELPITYTPACSHWDLSLVPIYNWSPNSNSVSIEWGAINSWGARLELGYNF